MARFTSTAVALFLVTSSVALVALAPSVSAAPTYYDVDFVSFDGTHLAVTVFVPAGASSANRVPFVLMTHGWAGARIAEPTGRVADLLAAGYGVLTWDSRGFGASGGEVMLDSPDFEVKDVKALVSYVATNIPSAQRTGLDPVVGMSGGSYAGGIQLLAAAFDPRIDVIAPEITWNDLAQSLGPNGVPKLYWTSLLFGAGLEASCVNARNGDPTGAVQAAIIPVKWASSGCQTSDLALWYAEVQATNTIPDDLRAALEYRSPKTYMSQIDIPTLLIQGSPDTLFDVNQAAANYDGIKANGAPVKLWLYDGGHGHVEGGLPNTQAGLISPTVIQWMDRYLKGDTSVDTGAEVEYYAAGVWHQASAWPDPTASVGSLHQGGIPSFMQGPVAGGPASSYTLKLADGAATLAGPAHVSFDVSGSGTEAILFFALAARDAGGNVTIADAQVQPARAAFDVGGTAHVAIDLVSVQASVPVGGSLALVISSFDRNYNGNRVPGAVNVVNIDVDWSTVA